MKINVKECGIVPENSPELTGKIRKLLERYRDEENVVFYFPKGAYHFYPDYAEEILLFIPNHDEDTIKRVVFHFSGYKNVKILGEDTEFVFHTDTLPFLFRECHGVTMEGITIDYERPGHSQGIIRKLEKQRMVLEINGREFPWKEKYGRMYFYGEHWEYELWGWIEMDRVTMETGFGLCDGTFRMTDRYRKVGPDLVEVVRDEREDEFPADAKEGDFLVLRHHPRTHPAIYAWESTDLEFQNVKIHHAQAMGLVAFRCRNLRLEHVQVCRNEVRNHVFTAEADGFQFICCAGQVYVHQCLCENQMDDPVNVHGIYGRIHRVSEDGSFVIGLVHHQHKGVNLIEPGEHFRIVDKDTMLPFASGTALTVERWNKDYMKIRPEEKITGLCAGQALENTDWLPEIEISGCTFRNNRARGILCTAGKRAVIKNNYFHVAGAAILIEGDTNDWFESGAVEEVILEDNVFDRCAYFPGWGKAPIQISPGGKVMEEGKAFHGRIEVKNNVFRVGDERLLYGKNIGKLVWKNNTTEKADNYQVRQEEEFVLQHVLEFEKE